MIPENTIGRTNGVTSEFASSLTSIAGVKARCVIDMIMQRNLFERHAVYQEILDSEILSGWEKQLVFREFCFCVPSGKMQPIFILQNELKLMSRQDVDALLYAFRLCGDAYFFIKGIPYPIHKQKVIELWQDPSAAPKDLLPDLLVSVEGKRWLPASLSIMKLASPYFRSFSGSFRQSHLNLGEVAKMPYAALELIFKCAYGIPYKIESEDDFWVALHVGEHFCMRAIDEVVVQSDYLDNILRCCNNQTLAEIALQIQQCYSFMSMTHKRITAKLSYFLTDVITRSDKTNDPISEEVLKELRFNQIILTRVDLGRDVPLLNCHIDSLVIHGYSYRDGDSLFLNRFNIRSLEIDTLSDYEALFRNLQSTTVREVELVVDEMKTPLLGKILGKMGLIALSIKEFLFSPRDRINDDFLKGIAESRTLKKISLTLCDGITEADALALANIPTLIELTLDKCKQIGPEFINQFQKISPSIKLFVQGESV